MSFISLQDSNQSLASRTNMNENRLLIPTIFAYLIVNLLIHIIFFVTTIFNNNCQISNISRYLFPRYFTQRRTNSINSVNIPSLDTDQSCSTVLQIEVPQSLVTNKIFSTSSSSSSSLSSYLILESETILIRTIRSFGLFLCTCLLIVNWLRLGIYLFPILHPNQIQYSSTLCIIQSFFLHVLTLFHLNLTISIRLFWHVCFIFSKYWQTITYRRIITVFLCIFITLCIFTWPSIGDEWASIVFDHILNVCIVNYTFHVSYTFFVLSFTCIIPFVLLILSHYRQMHCIERRISKYFTTFKIKQYQQKLISRRKKQFQYISYIIVVWSLINIILLIGIHIPDEYERTIKSTIYYSQLLAFLFDPILYMLLFRSLSIVTLLRPTDEL